MLSTQNLLKLSIKAIGQHLSVTNTLARIVDGYERPPLLSKQRGIMILLAAGEIISLKSLKLAKSCPTLALSISLTVGCITLSRAFKTVQIMIGHGRYTFRHRHGYYLRLLRSLMIFPLVDVLMALYSGFLDARFEQAGAKYSFMHCFCIFFVGGMVYHYVDVLHMRLVVRGLSLSETMRFAVSKQIVKDAVHLKSVGTYFTKTIVSFLALNDPFFSAFLPEPL